MTVNSAQNQNWVGCTVRTPKTQVARTLRAQCPGRGRCWACSRLVARMSPQIARSWCAGRAHSVQVVGACRDLLPLVHPQARSRHRSQIATSWTTKPGRDVNPMSRPPFCPTKTVQVATSKMGSRHQLPWGSQNHVGTSNWCRDTTQATPGRDHKTGSRLPFLYQAPGQVATSFLGRDLPNDLETAHLLFGPITLIRSRPQNGVATSVPNRPGRDVNSMSRPPFQPNQNKRGRDLKTRSRHQIHSVLLRRQNPRSPSLRLTATQPGHDATS